MGKTRSSRRMRNCKSRNKRVGGGLFGDGSCTNCSPIKREFKRYYYKEGHFLCDYVNSLSAAKINALYGNLNDTERQVFINCIFENYINGVAIPTDIESTISSAVNELIDRRSKRLHRLSPNPQFNQSPVILSTGSSTGSEDPSTPDDDDDDDDDDGHDNVDDDREGLLPKRITRPASGTSSGGKSRRRHRRGRTLHKRRKSSKVRKIRRTRSHSRSRR